MSADLIHTVYRVWLYVRRNLRRYVYAPIYRAAGSPQIEPASRALIMTWGRAWMDYYIRASARGRWLTIGSHRRHWHLAVQGTREGRRLLGGWVRIAR